MPVEEHSFDRDAAERLLDEAGYAYGPDETRTTPEGEPLAFELLVSNQQQLPQQRAALDVEERGEYAARLQRIAAAVLPMLPLIHPPLTSIVRTTAFDQWYYTPGGVGGLVPSVNNKHAFITGRQTGGTA